MIATALAAKVGLILTVLSCGDGNVPAANCPVEELATYDQQTWIGPTESDLQECVSLAETLIRSGGRARCEVVPAGLIQPATFDYKPAAQKLAF